MLNLTFDSLQEKLKALLLNANNAVTNIKTPLEIEQLRTRYLGKKGELTELLKQISQVPVSDRPKLGQAVNQIKQELQAVFLQKEQALQVAELSLQLQRETIDITLPGRSSALGGFHPITRTRLRVEELFIALGFQVAEGPEIEDEYHNFDALNIPVYHPARDSLDTFYFANKQLLRTHTSPVQIRVMQQQIPPLRIITPGRVFRRDSDHTHTPMFHQLEGLVVDKDCNFANLKNLLQNFFNQFFETELNLRFRASFFPFTEPSAEVDIMHLLCGGRGCRTCGDSGWLEVLGCGMVHPKVLANVGIDANEYQGFAFGLGLDRLAMLRYGIADLRTFFENDIRLLKQFS